MARRLALLALVASVLVVAGSLAAMSANAMSNGAPQLQCIQCHVGADKNPAEFVVEGLPEAYEPGKEYRITIRITKGPDCPEGASCGGFAITASAGSLIVVDPANTMESTTATGEKFLTHTKEGSMRREWTVAWKAPETAAGDVTFRIAVIAANGDGSFNGDSYGYKEIVVKPKAGAPKVITETEYITRYVTIRTPTATVIEYNAGFAIGVAVAIFVIVVAAYLLLTRR